MSNEDVEHKGAPITNITLTEELFPEGSLGRDVLSTYPEVIGRVRPTTVVDGLLDSSVLRYLKHVKNEQALTDAGVQTVRDFLSLSDEQLREAAYNDIKLESTLQNLERQIRNLAILPQTRLIETLYPPRQALKSVVKDGVIQDIYQSNSVPIEREPEVIQAVDQALSHLSEREREIIERRYGLKTWLPDSSGDVAKSYGITTKRLEQIERRILGRMRIMRAIGDMHLEGYIAFPETSIGRTQLGLELRRDFDISVMENNVNDHLPQPLAHSLRELNISKLGELLESDISDVPEDLIRAAIPHLAFLEANRKRQQEQTKQEPTNPPKGLTPQEQAEWWRKWIEDDLQRQRKEIEPMTREIEETARELDRLNDPDWNPTKDL